MCVAHPSCLRQRRPGGNRLGALLPTVVAAHSVQDVPRARAPLWTRPTNITNPRIAPPPPFPPCARCVLSCRQPACHWPTSRSAAGQRSAAGPPGVLGTPLHVFSFAARVSHRSRGGARRWRALARVAPYSPQCGAQLAAHGPHPQPGGSHRPQLLGCQDAPPGLLLFVDPGRAMQSAAIDF